MINFVKSSAKSALALAFLLFLLSGNQVNAASFDDTQDHWAEPFIEDLTTKGVVNGYLDGTFRPNNNINRAELTKIAVLASSGIDDSLEISQIFSDVPVFEWYYEVVQTAENLGVIQGYPREVCAASGLNYPCFRPDLSVSRAEAVKILVSAFDLPDNLSEGSQFYDVDTSDWYHDYVVTAANECIINSSGYFEPKSPISRGEVTKILSNILTLKEGGCLCSDCCTLDSDCPDDQACISQTCVYSQPNVTCTIDSDCASGEVCVDDTCVVDPGDLTCELDSDCGFEEFCVDQQCVPILPDLFCELDSDCASGEVCVDQICQLAQPDLSCQSDNDCATGETCNAQGNCVIAALGCAQEFSFSQTASLNEEFEALSSDWHFADWSFEGNATRFRPENGRFEGGKLILELKKETYDGQDYTSAEYRTNDSYGYGRYEVRMKPAAFGGVVSSFFLFLDNVDLSTTWNEVDIEFTYPTQDDLEWKYDGNYSAEIQFNHWNEPGSEHPNDFLEPFDLRSDFHNYAIEYTPSCIKWYIDDVLYHQAETELPDAEMRIMMNLWRPEDTTEGWNWAGEVDDSVLPLTSEYDYVRFFPLEN